MSNKEAGSLHREGRRILRLLTQEPVDHLIAQEPGGRPYFVDHRGDFNISHTGRTVAVTYTQARSTLRGVPLRTGCDIEHLHPRRNLETIASRFFTREEHTYITGGTSERVRTTRFYQLWVVKECFLKTLGLGLGFIHHTPNFIQGNTLGHRLTCQDPGSTCTSELALSLYLYALGDFPEEQYLLALAQERNPRNLEPFPPELTVRWFSQESLTLRNMAEISVLVYPQER
ncbi:MAG: 4'-phosphopantetheinyl transferase superfamily protein [Treponema sp.]|nr:4'-phosphopantetheinyl transferase superfamily protein [Treponema sp.]